MSKRQSSASAVKEVASTEEQQLPLEQQQMEAAERAADAADAEAAAALAENPIVVDPTDQPEPASDASGRTKEELSELRKMYTYGIVKGIKEDEKVPNKYNIALKVQAGAQLGLDPEDPEKYTNLDAYDRTVWLTAWDSDREGGRKLGSEIKALKDSSKYLELGLTWRPDAGGIRTKIVTRTNERTKETYEQRIFTLKPPSKVIDFVVISAPPATGGSDNYDLPF